MNSFYNLPGSLLLTVIAFYFLFFSKELHQIKHKNAEARHS